MSKAAAPGAARPNGCADPKPTRARRLCDPDQRWRCHGARGIDDGRRGRRPGLSGPVSRPSRLAAAYNQFRAICRKISRSSSDTAVFAQSRHSAPNSRHSFAVVIDAPPVTALASVSLFERSTATNARSSTCRPITIFRVAAGSDSRLPLPRLPLRKT